MLLGMVVSGACAGPGAPGGRVAALTNREAFVAAIGVAPTVAALRPETSGDPVVRGVALAIRDLNAARIASRGPRFELRMPARGARTAVNTATGFRDDSTVIGVVGPTDSQSALDASPLYSDVEHNGTHGVVAIAPTASSPVLSGRSAWFFRVCPDDRAASRAAARYAYDSLGVRRAAIVYRNDVYGKGWSRGFARAFVAAGGAVVFREPEAARLTEWAAPYAAYAKRSRADLLVVAGSGSDAYPLMLAARSVDLRVPVLGGDGLSDVRDPATRRVIGDARFASLFDARRAPSARGRRFVAAFTAAYGSPPGQQSALAYDAAMLLGEAVRATGPDRRGVRAYLETLGRVHPPFAGVTGPIAFDRSHDVVDKPLTMARVADQ